MKEYLVSVKIEAEVQLVVEASSESGASSKALETSFVIVEQAEIPKVIIKNGTIAITEDNIQPQNATVVTEIKNPILKKRLKDDRT
tara:strand:- start:1528 stop:1785 length:258 start_codon:yes stop_codon:yes gene_type:complete